MRNRGMAGRLEEAVNATPGPQERSFLRMLLGLLASEHVCSPPDGAAHWRAVSEETCIRTPGQVPREVYVCPECGQRLMRETTQAR